MENIGNRVEDYHDSYTESLTKAESLRLMVDRQTNELRTIGNLPLPLMDLGSLKEEVSQLQNGLGEEPWLSNLLLGGNEKVALSLETVQRNLAEFENGYNEFPIIEIPKRESFELNVKGEIIVDSDGYTSEVAKVQQQHTEAVDDALLPLTEVGQSISSVIGLWRERVEVFTQLSLVIKLGLAAGIVFFLFFTLLYIRRKVFSPLLRIIDQTNHISEHDLSTKIEINEPGAVEEVSLGVNKLVDNMRAAAAFAYNVGEGDLEAELDLVQTKDPEEPQANLAVALTHMRNRLREFAEEEQKRNWAAEGLTYFVEILRAEYSDLESMGQQIITGLVNYLSANQGAIYLVKEGSGGEPDSISGLAAFAWGHRHNLKASFGMDEGLIGAAIDNNRTIYMTDLPEDYARIRSGLGDAQPRNVLITPLSINEVVVGAIELASFHLLRDFEIDMIQKIGENIATSINGVQTSLKTKQLLVQSQTLARQLSDQEQQVRKNLEELESTQTRMMANQMELDGVLSAIDKSMAMAEFDLNGKIVEANNSFLKLTGYRLSELRGKSHEVLLPDSEASREGSKDIWQSLKQGKFRRGEFNRVTAKGQEIWIYASYNPILGTNAKPSKVLLLASDITSQKLSALDFEGQINAINQTNAVAEFDLEGNFLKVNPLFCSLTGYEESEFKDKHHHMVVPDQELSTSAYFDRWGQLKHGKAVEGEFKMKTRTGSLIWVRGSFNPIFDLEMQPIKVVSVLIDITTQKMMELQIKEQIEQMAAQEEELRQNMEEMQATHEEMDRNQMEMSGILSSIDKSMAMVEYDLDGNIIMVNNSFLELTGYSSEELMRKHHNIFLPEKEQGTSESERFWTTLQKGMFEQGNFKRLGKFGKEIWFNSVYNPIPGRDGHIYKIVQFATDITERMLSSLDYEGQVAAISRSNAVAEFNMEGLLLDANEPFLKIAGKKINEIKNQPFADFWKEEFKNQAHEIWDELTQSNFVEGEYEWATERELPLWVKGTFNPILDMNGDPFKVVLIANDITHPKMLQIENGQQLNMLAAKEMESRKNLRQMTEAQEQLKKSEAQIRGQMNAINATNAKVEFNLEGAIISANEIFLNITGFSEEEITDYSHELLLFEPEENGAFWEQLLEGESMIGEFLYKKRSGEELWVHASFTPILDVDGQPYKILSLATDITERKHNESKIVEANEKLNLTLYELTSAQDRLIVSEKMASLGQLVAGVAHEINTPISAVKASVRNMARILPNTLSELPRLLSKVPPEMAQVFGELVDKSMNTEVTLTTKEERAHKKEIQRYLDEIGIEDSYEIASKLVSIRVLDEIEKFLPLIEEEEAGICLDIAYSLGQLKVNMDNIDTAAEKTTKIVFALKSYTHVQSTDQFVMTNLSENLDLILTVYQNQLKYGVEVIRNYEEIPQVPIFPDELGQVWTNIIHNAIQAMKNDGKLSLDILKQDEFAVVRITDSGPGIPKDIKDRIFEPFFTTKAQGEGTGLGLDICVKIVEKHGGRIEVDSEPGRTTFTISLPFEQPEQGEEDAQNVVSLEGEHSTPEQKTEEQDELLQVG